MILLRRQLIATMHFLRHLPHKCNMYQMLLVQLYLLPCHSLLSLSQHLLRKLLYLLLRTIHCLSRPQKTQLLPWLHPILKWQLEILRFDLLALLNQLNVTVVDTAVLLVTPSYTVAVSVRTSAPFDVPDKVNANVNVS